MNNAKTPPYIPVPLELLGGLYTEATPETLPLGASPLVINCDFILGSTFQRPGKQSQYYFDGLFVEKLTAFASSIAGAHDPNEQAWTTPTNATLNIAGTYAQAVLNQGLPLTNGVLGFDKSAIGTGNGTAVTTPSISPGGYSEWALFDTHSGSSLISPTPTGDWTFPFATYHPYQQPAPVSAAVSGSATMASTTDWASYVALLTMAGASVPAFVQGMSVSGGLSSPTNYTLSASCVAGNTILVTLRFGMSGGGHSNCTVSIGGVQGQQLAINYGATTEVSLWAFFNIAGGSTTFQVSASAVTLTNNVSYAEEYQGGTLGPATKSYSQVLQCLNFPFSISPTVKALGFQVEISGRQSSSAADAILSVSLINPSATSPTFTTQLPFADGTVTVGTPITTWGLPLTPSTFNNPNFGINIVASAANGTPVTFDIYAVKVKVWITPDPPPSFTYIKTFAETGGEVLNMALGSDGIIYQEDAINAPGMLTSVYTAIAPASFAQSATVDDREFIAISNLQNGTEMPYTYTPPNFDRLSQVGPGATPMASTTSAGSTVISITQNAKELPPTSTSGTSGSWVGWAASPQDTGSFGNAATPGNLLLFTFPNSYVLPSYIKVGVSIVVTGVQTMNGYDPNNSVGGNPAFYTIIDVGQPDPSQQYYHGFSVVVPKTGWYGDRAIAGFGFQSTIATLTTSAQIPNLEVGNQFQLSGTGGAPPAGYDSTWTVLDTPNAAQMSITSTQLLNNVATYGYTLLTGSTPVIGQAVTITQTLNGNGVFNISNGIISAASAGTFSVSLVGANISNAAETGAGIIFGTIFTFDAFAIVGTKSAGSIITSGQIAAGVRKVCYSFLTRNGFITQPSPIATFDITAGAAGIAIANLAVGPSNVIARIIHFTAANGGNFYNIPAAVTVNSNGTNIVNTSTWVNDNVSTNVVLSFSDGVLLASDQIDIQGNNLFECSELGSCVALVPYAERLFAIGEQNKVFNFLNYSFDGGIGIVQGNVVGGIGSGSNATYPLGWTVDPTNGAGGSVVTSPLFGNAYQIYNQSGVTKTTYGMITQAAYQDEFLVPIIQASTTYSVRLTCSVPTGASAGNLVVDLYSAKFGKSFGTYTLTLSSILTSMQIYSGTLLTSSMAPVPNDLVLRVYATNIANGVQIQIDRVEPFPTEMPNLNTQVIGSYQGNFEAFDRLSGVVLATQQNQQPVVSAFTLFGALYLVKNGSLLAVNNNNTTEPSGWTVPRVVSNSVGAVGPNAVTTGIDDPNSGEEWALIGGRPGLFLFNGSQPVKLSEEIQSLWNQINWNYGYTIWTRNDVTNRRILVGVPLKTPNTWLPTGIIPDDSNPTTPNVVLELNYKQLNTPGALMESVQIHRSYSGKLIASDIVRKWGIWTIKAPCAAFVQRSDKTAPLFIGNSDANGKIYELVDNLGEDDGVAIDQRYATAGFVPTETGQGMQMSVTRYLIEYATILITGSGALIITVYPNTLTSQYSHDLLPNLTLPLETNGDVEIPINEVGNRLFFVFRTNAVSANFELSRMIVIMRQDPWSPVRGVNS